MKVRVMLTVRGKVQGVSYRKHTLKIAQELNVVGWVRNQTDGTVCGCFEGNCSSVEALMLWCSIGPERARVHSIERKIDTYTGAFLNFRIL